MEKPSKLNINNELIHGKGKEVKAPIIKIPRPPPSFPLRIKKKAEDGKFRKFIAISK